MHLIEKWYVYINNVFNEFSLYKKNSVYAGIMNVTFDNKWKIVENLLHCFFHVSSALVLLVLTACKFLKFIIPMTDCNGFDF